MVSWVLFVVICNKVKKIRGKSIYALYITKFYKPLVKVF